mgnify:CR=1 FL=1
MTHQSAEKFLHIHSNGLQNLCKRIEDFRSQTSKLPAPTRRSAHQSLIFKSLEADLNIHIQNFFTRVFKDSPKHWKANDVRVFSQNSVLRSQLPDHKSVRINTLNTTAVLGYFAILSGAFVLPHDTTPDPILDTLNSDEDKDFVFYQGLNDTDKSFLLTGQNPTDALAKMCALSHPETSALFAPDSQEDSVEQFFHRTAQRTRHHIQQPAIWSLGPHFLTLIEGELEHHAPKPKAKITTKSFLQNIHLEQGQRVFERMDLFLLELWESLRALPKDSLTSQSVQSSKGQSSLRASNEKAAWARVVLNNFNTHPLSCVTKTFTVNGKPFSNPYTCS